MSTRSIVPIALLAALAAALTLGAVPALAKDGDVLARGACTGGSTAKLKLGAENGRIEVEAEVVRATATRNGERCSARATFRG